MKLFVESDVDADALTGERIAVLGYGSQGRAHARNLRDSGYAVVVGLRPGGKTTALATQDGFEVVTPGAAVKGAGLVAFLTPDMAQGQLYREARDYGRADLLFRRATAYRDVREAASVARAGVAIDQESFDDALTVLRNAVTLNPTSTELRRNVDVLEDIVLLRSQR